MDPELQNRVAVVTGASSGIGRTVAEALAPEGVQTVVVARPAHLLETLQQEVAQIGGKRPHVTSTAGRTTRSEP